MTKAEIDNRELQLKIGKYGDMLFKLSLLRLQNPQDAEDVVQEVFYQYIRFYGTFQSEEHEKAWLLKTTVNACRKVWRSAWKRHRSSEEWTQILEEGKGMQEGTAGGGAVTERDREKAFGSGAGPAGQVPGCDPPFLLSGTFREGDCSGYREQGVHGYLSAYQRKGNFKEVIKGGI